MNQRVSQQYTLTKKTTIMTDKNTLKPTTPETNDLPLSVRLSMNISARRRSLGLTQAQLAERLGVDTETLSRFERGKHLPSLSTLERLAGLLMMSVGELLAEQPKTIDDDSLIIASWLSPLCPEDKEFTRGLLRLCCEYLDGRDLSRPTSI
jgi:transcriptional regulator with XRE-family HTH domain